MSVAISDTPWSQFKAGDYSPEQWQKACVLHLGDTSPPVKGEHKLPVREPDGTVNRNGVHAAAARLNQTDAPMDAKRAAARELVGLYRTQLKEDPPASLLMLARMDGAMRTEDSGPVELVRSYPLEDIAIRAGGDGRTVEAYAAVFNTETTITSEPHNGVYVERLAPSAFTKSIAERGTRFGVFYNHGLTLHGTPSDAGSVPIGTPVEVRADSRGLLTVTRYNKTPLAEAVLETIRDGGITGQSFTGRIIKSNPQRVPRTRTGAAPPTVVRTEIALKEYGPTPFPAYPDAAITAVRAEALLAQLVGLDEEQRAELMRMLTAATPLEPAPSTSTTATPVAGAGAEESQQHSGRPSGWIGLRSALRDKGVV